MLLSTIKVLADHKRQVIPDLNKVVLPEIFRGRPELTTKGLDPQKLEYSVKMCPTRALGHEPFSLDMGRCIFCGECAKWMPQNIKFTSSWRIWSLTREGLVVKADEEQQQSEPVNKSKVKGNHIFKNSLRLRQVCSGGDGSIEMELGAACNVNFDMSRHGLEFVASPRHADGVLITGPLTKKMAGPLNMTYSAIADPKVVVLAGADAISGGVFEDSSELDRSFLDSHKVDLYIPGHPSHPLAIIGGLRDLMSSYTL